jgi:NDP-sugar pyrophosphorylase family protein
MAGKGTRFKNYAHLNKEFLKPKPSILIDGRPMIWWSVRSIKAVPKKDLFFLILEEHVKDHKIDEMLRKLFGKKINIIVIPKLTRGALETALLAKKYINKHEDIIISDSDHFFEGNSFFNEINKKRKSTVGIIPVDRQPKNEIKHSYTLTTKHGYALKIAEKDPEMARKGAYSNIGAYYFSSAKLFFKHAEENIKKGLLSGPPEKQEFYIAPLYQKFIEQGKRVKVAVVKWAWRLGTPEDVERFLREYKTKKL